MRKQTVVAFNDFIAGTPPVTVYTPTELNDLLGQYDQLAIEVIADQYSGSVTTPAFSVDLQHSGDGRNWVLKTGGFIGSTGLAANTTATAAASDAGTTPSLGLIRFAINFTGSGSSGQFHLKLIVTQRDQA